MKIFKLTYGLMVAAAMTLVSCNLNEAPEFDDADAFVAIQQTAASVSETGGELKIPVMLTSLAGIQGSVDYEISFPESGAAEEGVHYTLAGGSKTLTFTKDAPVQYIVFNIIDNDTFGGDKKLIVKLTNPQGVKLGATKECNVTIEDDEHPLSFILGEMNATGADYFGGGAPETWTATFAKDTDDLNKVWIYGICSGGCSSSYPVYGIVNEDKTEIRIPVGQTTAMGSYDVKLEGWDGLDPDASEYLAAGSNIIGKISPDGTITINTAFGAHAYSPGTTNSAGWYAIEMGAVFKK